MLVCGLVFVDAGEALLLQKVFFALKVHLGELDEALELQADGAAIDSVDEHDASSFRVSIRMPC